MATSVTRVGPVGRFIEKIVDVTVLTASRQAVVVGARVVSAQATNNTDETAVRVEKNVDADGNTSNGSVAVTNGDAGPDSVEVRVLVAE